MFCTVSRRKPVTGSCVNHSDDAIADELNTIVDNGGKVLDVIIEHEITGKSQPISFWRTVGCGQNSVTV
ncbi:MAG: 3H domain-containing protein [Coprococcus sp.]